MEDLDPPREIPGAAEQILHSLKIHGLRWDGPVLWQSERHAAYGAVIDTLLERRQAFRCDCTRAMLHNAGGVYPGTCRDRHLTEETESATRLRLEGDTLIRVDDAIQPALQQNLARETGDFIIKRRDGLFAYQLAVVLDDAYQQINVVMRGSDLYDSTPRQVYLQRLLGLPTPRYAHIPVIVNADGQKLSKQTHAPALADEDALHNLRQALRFLGQPDINAGSVEDLLRTAVSNWDRTRVPTVPGIPESELHTGET